MRKDLHFKILEQNNESRKIFKELMKYSNLKTSRITDLNVLKDLQFHLPFLQLRFLITTFLRKRH